MVCFNWASFVASITSASILQWVADMLIGCMLGYLIAFRKHSGAV